MRRSKFGNCKVKLDGYTFDSKLEARRYAELKLLERGRQIHCLVVHPLYPIILNGKTVCRVEMDFAYFEMTPDMKKEVVEDTKGFFTPMSRLKHKLFAAQHPNTEIRIVKA